MFQIYTSASATNTGRLLIYSSHMGQALYTSTRYYPLHFVAADSLHHRLRCAAVLALQ